MQKQSVIAFWFFWKVKIQASSICSKSRFSTFVSGVREDNLAVEMWSSLECEGIKNEYNGKVEIVAFLKNGAWNFFEAIFTSKRQNVQKFNHT